MTNLMTNAEDKTMLKPYRQVEKTDDYMVYEFRTIYLYLLYGIIGMIVVGYLADMFVLSIVNYSVDLKIFICFFFFLI